MIFPTIQTKDLNGAQKTLPDDFVGQWNLIFIAYVQNQQYHVDSWLPLVGQLGKALPDFQYYELPVVGEMSWFGRNQLDFWMRTGIQDFDTRARTLTLYVNKAKFRDPLAIDTEREIAILLVNGRGEVVWRTMGHYTHEKGRQLQNFLTPELI